jgi:hypothetical protein
LTFVDSFADQALNSMAKRISAAFEKKPAFVGYITGGFPSAADTVPAMLAMQAAGVDVIEVCLPELQHGVLILVRVARSALGSPTPVPIASSQSGAPATSQHFCRRSAQVRCARVTRPPPPVSRHLLAHAGGRAIQ